MAGPAPAAAALAQALAQVPVIVTMCSSASVLRLPHYCGVGKKYSRARQAGPGSKGALVDGERSAGWVTEPVYRLFGKDDPRQIGEFELLGVLGTGGMGRVISVSPATDMSRSSGRRRRCPGQSISIAR